MGIGKERARVNSMTGATIVAGGAIHRTGTPREISSEAQRKGPQAMWKRKVVRNQGSESLQGIPKGRVGCWDATQSPTTPAYFPGLRARTSDFAGTGTSSSGAPSSTTTVVLRGRGDHGLTQIDRSMQRALGKWKFPRAGSRYLACSFRVATCSTTATPRIARGAKQHLPAYRGKAPPRHAGPSWRPFGRHWCGRLVSHASRRRRASELVRKMEESEHLARKMECVCELQKRTAKDAGAPVHHPRASALREVGCRRLSCLALPALPFLWSDRVLCEPSAKAGRWRGLGS